MHKQYFVNNQLTGFLFDIKKTYFLKVLYNFVAFLALLFIPSYRFYFTSFLLSYRYFNHKYLFIYPID